jgi:UDP-glucuronate 4-epimerase
MSKLFLVTGSAGFIGFHLARRLIADGHRVVGYDDLNDYYSVELKRARLELLSRSEQFTFVKAKLEDGDAVREQFDKHEFSTVFHLAAQAGVRYSLEHPEVYIRSNIDGTLNILEAVRRTRRAKPHLLMASSSSVYGLSERYPLREDDPADRPVALYGVTKRSNELMGHSYAHLFGLRVTMLRFFTVYGPWGRPDMALFKFVRAILEDKEIEIYNNGDMVRDFTYVDDIVDGMLGLEKSRLDPKLPAYDLFNIGCSHPRTLMEFVRAIEKATGKKARLKNMPFQSGDIYKTHADVSKIRAACGYAPKTEIERGVAEFVKWYRDYHKC